jgi:hypothetical protein
MKPNWFVIAVLAALTFVNFTQLGSTVFWKHSSSEWQKIANDWREQSRRWEAVAHQSEERTDRCMDQLNKTRMYSESSGVMEKLR